MVSKKLVWAMGVIIVSGIACNDVKEEGGEEDPPPAKSKKKLMNCGACAAASPVTAANEWTNAIV